MKSPYEILGVSAEASMEEIEAIFKERKKEYSESLLLEGPEGVKASVRYQAIKDAYQEILNIKSADAKISDGDRVRPLGRIEELIKANDLKEAQRLLDLQTERQAEWHYLQSAVFYKKGWMYEAKLQLELAQKIAPGEKKYLDAYNALVNVMTYGHPEGLKAFQENNAKKSYPAGDVNNLSCCTLCEALICADCCCDCFDCMGH